MTACPRCGAPSPVRLAPDAPCDACRSLDAWSRIGAEGPLVIERKDIERSEARARGDARRARLLAYAALAASVAAVGASGAALFVACKAFSGRPVGDPHAIANSLRAASVRALVFAGVAVVLTIATTRLRARRSLILTSLRSGAAVLGVAALLTGLVSLFRVSAYGSFADLKMPAPAAMEGFGPSAQRVMRSTVVVFAPDEDGDATQPAIGTASIVRRSDDRAILLTCAHVAVPWSVVGARVDLEKVSPLWLVFADGRAARGSVVWVGEPPLDVALVDVPIADPPPALTVLPSAARLNAGDEVFFVPNPLLHGFAVHQGSVAMRETHETPAGVFDLIDTDLPVVSGDSGSGLFDGTGRLVGVNTWRAVGRGSTRGISLPTEVIANATEALNSIPEGTR